MPSRSPSPILGLFQKFRNTHPDTSFPSIKIFRTRLTDSPAGDQVKQSWNDPRLRACSIVVSAQSCVQGLCTAWLLTSLWEGMHLWKVCGTRICGVLLRFGEWRHLEFSIMPHIVGPLAVKRPGDFRANPSSWKDGCRSVFQVTRALDTFTN